MEGNKKTRVYWIDIFKALAIILVVIGHSTGTFNAYIYQFHVAAFFFISGWVSQMDTESLGKDVYKKFMSLILPLFTMVILFGIVIEFLKITNLYNIYYAGLDLSLSNMVKNFVSCGSLIDLLGAAWFIEVLFIASLLSHIIYYFSRKRIWLFSIITIIVYVYGYVVMKRGDNYFFGFDIALVAQGYYGVAFALKRGLPSNKESNNRKVLLFYCFLFFVTSLCMLFMKRYLHGENLMDLANRIINNLWWSSVAVANGVLWLCSLSHLISCIKASVLKRTFVFIGKSTMGIMVLHFAFFRVVATCLYIVGVVPIEECLNLVPSAGVGIRFWWLYVMVAIIGSLLTWSLFGKIILLSQFLGINKGLAKQIPKFKPCKEIIEVYKTIIDAIVGGVEKYIVQRKALKKANVIYSIIIIAIFLAFVCCKYIPTIDIAPMEESNVVEGSVSVSFPYSGSEVSFRDGWLEQNKDEDYRWVRKESTFEINLSEQKRIEMLGYVPSGIEGLSNVKLYLNGNLISESQILGEQMLVIQGDFSDYAIHGNNVFKLIFDNEHAPQKEDADQRTFSAMFTSILIE